MLLPVVEVVAPNVVVTPETQTLLDRRIEHLTTLFDRIAMIRVAIDAPTEHHQKGGPFQVRVDLEVPGNDIAVTQQQADSLPVAIREAFDAADRQLKAHVEKMRGY